MITRTVEGLPPFDAGLNRQLSRDASHCLPRPSFADCSTFPPSNFPSEVINPVTTVIMPAVGAVAAGAASRVIAIGGSTIDVAAAGGPSRLISATREGE